MPFWQFQLLVYYRDLAFLIWSPHIVPLLALLTEYADLSDATDGKITTGYGDLFLAQIAMQMQMNLVLIDSTVELRIKDHWCRTRNIILTRIVVVTLIIGIIIVGSHWDRGCRARCPGTIMITRATCTACTTTGKDVRLAGSGWHQGQGRGRRAAVSWIHGNAIRRIGVLLSFRRKYCKQKMII